MGVLLSGRDNVAPCMARMGGDLAIIPKDQSVVTLPEYRYLEGTKDFTGRPRDGFHLRGLGGVRGQPVSSAGEEQLLGTWGPEHPFYPYRGLVAVHEYAHGIQNLCFTSTDRIKWDALYREAKEADVFPDSHMMYNHEEFFAVLTTVYFGVTRELGDGLSRESIKDIVPRGVEVLDFLDDIYGGAVLPEIYTTRERNPSTPEPGAELLTLPWIADGVDDGERGTAEKLTETARWWPESYNALLQQSWLQDDITRDEAAVVEHVYWLTRSYDDELTRQRVSAIVVALLELPWMRDGITGTEREAVEWLRWLAGRNEPVAAALIEMPWMQDDMTRDEATVIEYIYWITRAYRDEETRRKVAAAVVDLLAMPFLNSVESADAMAVWDLSKIAGDSPDDFLDIMAHPNISDGITDEEAKVVTVLSSAYRNRPKSLPILLEGLDGTEGVYLEERTIELPLAGEVQLTIVRIHDKKTPNMDRLEHAVRVVEEFMGIALPTNYVAWYLDDAARSAGRGYHAGTHITSSLVYDIVDGTRKSRTPMQHIAHEVGHYYFRGNTHQWLDEGPAKFFESISERERVGRPVAPFHSGCTASKTLAQQEQLRNDIIAGRVKYPPDRWTRCDYYLGERFFVDLYLAIGDEAFRPGLRRLYLKSQWDDPADNCEGIDMGICHVMSAFMEDASDDTARKLQEVVRRWYGRAVEP